MPPTKSQRWLDLLALLLGRTIPLTVEEIMERVPGYGEKWRTGDPTAQASARRTFERDKDDLRRIGVPLEPVHYTLSFGGEQIEGYRLAHGDFYLPYLKLLSPEAEGVNQKGRPPATSPAAPASAAGAVGARAGRRYSGLPSLDLSASEAELALEALRRGAGLPAFPFAADARSALRKIGFDLDPGRFPGEPVVWAEPPGAREVLERLRTLSDALLARKRIGLVYHGIHRGRPSDREVEPYGLFYQRDWYLVARDPAADALRLFRVSRIAELRPNTRAPKSPDYAIPPDFDLRDHLGRNAWELHGEEDEQITAEVRFRSPLSLQLARTGEGELVREEEGGAAVRAFSVSQPDPFLRWILSLAGDAEILAPPELREASRAQLREVAAIYAGDRDTEAVDG
jgi:proteasome accessory factor B